MFNMWIYQRLSNYFTFSQKSNEVEKEDIMKKIKIAFVGTHRVGKTSLMLRLAADLKEDGRHVEIIKEVARRCPLAINQQTTLEAQMWILFEHIQKEFEELQHCDILLTDRAICNYGYLTKKFGRLEFLEPLLKNWCKSFDLMIYVPIALKIIDDGEAMTDPREQRDYDQEIRDILNLFKDYINLIELPQYDISKWKNIINRNVYKVIKKGENNAKKSETYE